MNQRSLRMDQKMTVKTPGAFPSVACLILLAFMFFGRPGHAQATMDPAPDIRRLQRQANADLQGQKMALAAEEYQRILSLDSKNVEAHANLGLVYYLQAQFALASEQFEAALRLKPDLWETAALGGLSEMKTGQRAIAKPHLQQAFEHVADPKLRMAVGKQLFSLLFEEGDLSDASAVVNELQKTEPTNVDVLYAAHQVYSLMANRAFLSMAQLAPDSARMYQLRGDKMIQSGNLPGAIEAYRQAIQRDPHLAGAHFALGEALNTSQSAADRAQAEAQYKDALAENAQDERAECRLGGIDLDRSDMDGAMQHFKHALQIQPDDSDANEGLGMVLMAAKAYKDALVYLKRAVELEPTDGPAHYHLALVNRDLGDLDGANREMDEFRKLKEEKDSLRHSLNGLSPSGSEHHPASQEDPPRREAKSQE